MNLTQLIAEMRRYTGIYDETVHPDSLITNWIRIGEQRINQDLRIDDMLKIAEMPSQQSNILMDMPTDWLETDFLLKEEGKPYYYLDRFEFYKKGKPDGHFTKSGTAIIIGGKPDSLNLIDVEMHYFAMVPTLGATSTWVTTKHLGLIISASLIPAFVHMEEIDKSAAHEANVAGIISRLNESRMASRTVKGARLVRRVKSFG